MAEWFNAQNDWILNRVEDDDGGSLRMTAWQIEVTMGALRMTAWQCSGQRWSASLSDAGSG
tara:strand:+ start:93 stop:275 length:183 start_codon:yes stop_codon:yes gene_type:complete